MVSNKRKRVMPRGHNTMKLLCGFIKTVVSGASR